MKTRGLLWTSALGIALSTSSLNSPSAWAQVEGEKDCRYVVGTVTGLEARDSYNKWLESEPRDPKKAPPVLGRLAKATARYVQVPGCIPQCMGKIFCYSDNPQFKGKQATDLEMTQLGKDVTCDALPGARPAAPSCLSANKCMELARADKTKSHFGVLSKIGIGLPTYKNGLGSHTIAYGLVHGKSEGKVPMFTVPGDPDEDTSAKTCHVCASPFSVNEMGNDFKGCKALGDGKDGCPSAVGCYAQADSDTSSYAVSPVVGKSFALDGVTPPAEASAQDDLAAAGAAREPSKAKQ